ncbi:NYN domain-containing protein [Geodermatophilus sp. SYSU D00758]
MAQIALFIDFENLVLGAEETLPGRTNPVPYKALELLCRDYGNAAVRRAYADWSKPQFGRYQEDLGLNGVDLVQVKRFGVQQKNAADIRMAVDAMETLMVHPDVEVFMLVAGDGDYSPLVQKLREFGKTVVGVGTEASASRRLVAVCSEYKYWATLVAAVDPRARSAVAAEFDIERVRPLLVAALAESTTEVVVAAWLKTKMLALDPSFDERNYGYQSFGGLLEAMSDTVVVSAGDTDLQVSLRDRARENLQDSPATAAPLPADQEVPAALRLLRQRGMDMPTRPETRDSLLVSVHEGWASGAIRVVGDIGDVLLDEETGHVPNARTRNPLRHALVAADTRVIPLAEQPDEQRRLVECRVQPCDGVDCSDWVRSAHVAWLAWAAWKLRDQPDPEAALATTFFADAEQYGRELVPDAVARARLRSAD